MQGNDELEEVRLGELEFFDVEGGRQPIWDFGFWILDGDGVEQGVGLVSGRRCEVEVVVGAGEEAGFLGAGAVGGVAGVGLGADRSTQVAEGDAGLGGLVEGEVGTLPLGKVYTFGELEVGCWR